jgi:hypothetical protein
METTALPDGVSAEWPQSEGKFINYLCFTKGMVTYRKTLQSIAVDDLVTKIRGKKRKIMQTLRIWVRLY